MNPNSTSSISSKNDSKYRGYVIRTPSENLTKNPNESKPPLTSIPFPNYIENDKDMMNMVNTLLELLLNGQPSTDNKTNNYNLEYIINKIKTFFKNFFWNRYQ